MTAHLLDAYVEPCGSPMNPEALATLTRCASGRPIRVGQERVREDDRPQRVDPVRRQVLLERQFQERSAEHEAGVVDQDVDRSAFGVDAVTQRADSRDVGDVDAIGLHGASALGELLRGLEEQGLVEVGQQQVGPLGGEPLRDALADARRASGDEDALPVESAHGSLPAAPEEQRPAPRRRPQYTE